MSNTLGTAALRSYTLLDRAIFGVKIKSIILNNRRQLIFTILDPVGLQTLPSASEISVNRSELQRAAILQDCETMLQRTERNNLLIGWNCSNFRPVDFMQISFTRLQVNGEAATVGCRANFLRGIRAEYRSATFRLVLDCIICYSNISKSL